MENKSYLSWIEFYSTFATSLLGYSHNRKTLIEKLRKVYKNIRMKFPKLDSSDVVADIDPFTVFGIFNKGITNANRITILNGIAEEFSIKAPVPDTFNGIPLLNNMNATFYRFVDDPDRGENDIENLWNLFEASLSYADTPSIENREAFITAFDVIKDLKGNRWKLTMGLYWVRPMNYINLDSRNRWFIENPENMPSDCIAKIEGQDSIPSGADYISICDTFAQALKDNKYKYENFPELSYYAWKISEEVNQEQKEKNIQTKRGKTGAAVADENVDGVHYWIYSPGEGSSKWEEYYKEGIMAIGWGAVGDLSVFSSKDDMKRKMKECFGAQYSYKNAAHATWQFVNEMKPGDIVFVKKGRHQIIGRGVITSDYYYQEKRNDDYKNIRKINWTDKGEWDHPGHAVIKKLTDITAYTNYVEKLNALFENDDADFAEEKTISYPPYNVDNFLSEVYIDEGEYNNLVALLLNKKNIILQGAPGVGKTYAAKRLAYSIMGIKDKERVEMIQFHQSYSYEDFIMGFRPCEDGFELRKGIFYNFCKAAEIDNENAYFFIIDEINRGNLSKIFGELFMLIESDKRGVELQLLYADEKFTVPENVYIIGMMNTADRSLAMLDYALRRRFAFYEMQPAFKSDGFQAYQTKLNNPMFDRLIACVENLNSAIISDESLGEGFCIGHSYFCGLDNVDIKTLSGIVEYELIPLLKEYWFDEPMKVKEWSNNLRSAVK